MVLLPGTLIPRMKPSIVQNLPDSLSILLPVSTQCFSFSIDTASGLNSIFFFFYRYCFRSQLNIFLFLSILLSVSTQYFSFSIDTAFGLNSIFFFFYRYCFRSQLNIFSFISLATKPERQLKLTLLWDRADLAENKILSNNDSNNWTVSYSSVLL